MPFLIKIWGTHYVLTGSQKQLNNNEGWILTHVRVKWRNAAMSCHSVCVLHFTVTKIHKLNRLAFVFWRNKKVFRFSHGSTKRMDFPFHMLIIIHNDHRSRTKGLENCEIFVPIQFHQSFILKCFDDQNKCKMNGQNTIIQPTITQSEPAIRHEDLDGINGEKAKCNRTRLMCQ